MRRWWVRATGRARVPRPYVWVGAGILVLLLVWRLAVELTEPHLLLVLAPRRPYLETLSVANTSLRLYSDTRPHVGKISGLQKGLVWVRQGRLLVEEGYGFGAPIVEYQGRAYVARHAEIEHVAVAGGVRLIKHYQIDTVDTPVQFLHRKYRPVSPLGTITVQYDVRPEGVIDVMVDFSELKAAWTRVYLMNEQGARRFTRFEDAGGTLQGDEIGIWESSDQFSGRACMSTSGTERAGLRFCIEPVEDGLGPPVRMYYGRERYRQYNWRGTYSLSWAGVDLALEAPQARYSYRIRLEAR